MKTGFGKNVLASCALLCASIGVSGCVSDTLGSANTKQPVQTVKAEEPKYDPVARAHAVAEIREKAANANSGILTNAYAAEDGPNEPLTPEETQARINHVRMMAESANGAGSVPSDNELAAKKRRMQVIQDRAKDHYGKALNTIEN